MSKNYNRKRVLVWPRLQLRLIAALLGAASIAAVVQVLLLNVSLGRLAADLPVDGALLLDALPDIISTQVLVTFGLMVPLVVAVGILETFRVFGPLRRIEIYLGELAEGRRPEPCRLRQEDELQEFCRLVNEATQPKPAAGSQADRAKRAAQEAVPAPVPARAAQTMVILD